MPEQAMRPYVQVAAICQVPIQGADGALSLIRLIDRIPVQGFTDEMQPQPLNNFSMVVVLKAGEMRGQYRMRIIPHTPSGKTLPAAEVTVLFEGDERGIAAIAPLGVVAEETGLYWFDVMVEQEVLTRIPLRVMYQKIQLPPGFPGLPGMQGPPPR